eukprot:1613847-Pleurochrysis_carterae.AAC.1
MIYPYPIVYNYGIVSSAGNKQALGMVAAPQQRHQWLCASATDPQMEVRCAVMSHDDELTDDPDE